MTESPEKVAGFVDDLLKGRRPRRFPADEGDQQALQAATALAAATPGADAPNPRFVEHLRQRLAEAVDAAPHPASPTRRRFLGHFGLPAAAAVFGAAAATGAYFAVERIQLDADEGPELVPRLATAGWVPVLPLASLIPGRPFRFTAGAIQGFLILNHNSEVSAVSAVCTHMGCLLNPNPDAGQLDCPCHGASFSLDGAPLSPEYTRALPRLRTRVLDSQVEVYAV